MINLLPPESSKQLRAARHNTILLKYVIGLGVVLGLIVMICLLTLALMRSTELNSTASSEENKQKIARYNRASSEAKAYTENLRMAKSIFASEVSYTVALQKIAASLPAGTVLQSLDLSPSMVGQPITLTVLAKTKDDALKVKDQLEANKVASGITIASLNEGGASPASQSGAETPAVAQDYPVNLSLNLTFDKALFVSEEQPNA